MPWHVAKSKRCPKSKPWAVIADEGGDVVACHATEAAANRHLRALYANVPDARSSYDTMDIKTGELVLRTKFVEDGAGRIEGYASIFNNVDRVGDVVMPGAFGDKSFTAPFLAYHDRTMPIGGALCTPDTIGLAYSATLANTDKAQEIRELAKVGAIPAASFGYRIQASEPNEHGGLNLFKLEVLEVSAVPVPANPLALISAAKAFGSDPIESWIKQALVQIPTWDAGTKARMRDYLQQLHDMCVKAGAECGKSAGVAPRSLDLELATLEMELS